MKIFLPTFDFDLLFEHIRSQSSSGVDGYTWNLCHVGEFC